MHSSRLVPSTVAELVVANSCDMNVEDVFTKVAEGESMSVAAMMKGLEDVTQSLKLEITEQEALEKCSILGLADTDVLKLEDFKTFVSMCEGPKSEAVSASVGSEAALPPDTEETPVLTIIASRARENEFPLVLPKQLPEELKPMAAETLAWVQKEEYVRIQSYMQEKYSTFRASLPPCTLAEPIIHARWAREFYDVHLREYVSSIKDVAVDFTPMVNPDELPENERAGAKLLLRQVQPSHVPQIHARVAVELEIAKKTMKSSTLAMLGSVFEKTWAMKHYYCILSDVLVSGRASLFQPEVVPAQLPAADAAEARELLESLTVEMQPAFLEKLEAAFEAVWKRLPARDMERGCVRKHWIVPNYYGIMKGVIMNMRAFEFEPAIDVTDLPSTEQKRAAFLFQLVSPQHVEVIKKHVDEDFDAFCVNLECNVSPAMKDALKPGWLLDYYLSVVEKVVIQNDFVFAPALPLDIIDDFKERERAAEAYARVRAEHVDVIEKSTTNALQTFMTTLPHFCASATEEVLQQWLQSEYVSLVEQALPAAAEVRYSMPRSSSVGIDAPSVSSVCASPECSSPLKRPMDAAACNTASVDAFALRSPAKRGVEKAASARSVLRSAADYHLAEMCSGDKHAFVGYLLQPPELKWIEVTDRKTREKEVIQVMTLQTIDHAGPIVAKFWRQTAQDVCEKMTAWLADREQNGSNTSATQGRVLVQILNVSASREKGRMIPSWRCFHSSAHTTVEIFEEGRGGALIPGGSPLTGLDERLYLKDLQQVAHEQLPFGMSILGCVSELQGVEESRQGVEMRSFKFGDMAGHYIYVIAYGSSARSIHLVDGKAIILYFAKAVQGLAGESPKLWMYEEST